MCSSVAQGTNALHKGFNLFKQCKTPPLPSPARRSNCGRLPALLAHSRYSCQLRTITASIHGCVFVQRCNNQSKKVSSHYPWCKRRQNTRGKQREKIFSSRDRSAGSISQRVRTHDKTAGHFQSSEKKEKWSEKAPIITSSSGITRTARQCIPSNIWWRKKNEKVR